MLPGCSYVSYHTWTVLSCYYWFLNCRISRLISHDIPQISVPPRLHHSMCLAITTDAKGNRQLAGLDSVKMEGIWEGPVFWYRWARNVSAAADWCLQPVTPVSWWKHIPWVREMTLPKALKLLQNNHSGVEGISYDLLTLVQHVWKNSRFLSTPKRMIHLAEALFLCDNMVIS